MNNKNKTCENCNKKTSVLFPCDDDTNQRITHCCLKCKNKYFFQLDKNE